MNLYDYDISLHFAVTNRHVPLDRISAFLIEMPTYLQQICRRDLNFCVQYVRPTSTPTDITFWISVVPQPVEPALADEAMKMGIKDPVGTGAYADIMIWLASLRRLGDSPLQAAWSLFRALHPEEELSEHVPLILVDRQIAPRK